MNEEHRKDRNVDLLCAASIALVLLHHIAQTIDFLPLIVRGYSGLGLPLIVSLHDKLRTMIVVTPFLVLFTVLWDGGHIKFFSRRTLEAMLSEQGLIVSAFLGVGRCPYFWKSMFVKARVERSVDEQIY